MKSAIEWWVKTSPRFLQAMGILFLAAYALPIIKPELSPAAGLRAVGAAPGRRARRAQGRALAGNRGISLRAERSQPGAAGRAADESARLAWDTGRVGQPPAAAEPGAQRAAAGAESVDRRSDHRAQRP